MAAVVVVVTEEAIDIPYGDCANAESLKIRSNPCHQKHVLIQFSV